MGDFNINNTGIDNIIHPNSNNRDEKAFLHLFPERVIKASGFIDLFSTTKLNRTSIRIRNPTKKLVEDVNYA